LTSFVKRAGICADFIALKFFLLYFRQTELFYSDPQNELEALVCQSLVIRKLLLVARFYRRRDSRRWSMKKVRPVVARNAKELAKVLGLAPADGMEIEFRSDLNDKIMEVVGKKGLTHSDVARLAHTSRSRVTAILNRNTTTFQQILCCVYWPR
jgi:hypothetical protein